MLHHPTVGSLDLSDLSPGGWRYEALFDRYVTTSGFKTETLMRPFGEVPNYFKQTVLVILGDVDFIFMYIGIHRPSYLTFCLPVYLVEYSDIMHFINRLPTCLDRVVSEFSNRYALRSALNSNKEALFILFVKGY